jgi:hypothetical protein
MLADLRLVLDVDLMAGVQHSADGEALSSSPFMANELTMMMGLVETGAP